MADRVKRNNGLFALIVLVILLTASITGCSNQSTPSPTPVPLATEITFYDWLDDIPPSVFEQFNKEYGVKVTYITFESQEEAIENLSSGKVYDVIVMDNRFIPHLVKQNLLAKIDQRNIPNFKNISANFRDLVYDPGNQYTIPFNWGTYGLLYRKDLTKKEITRWSDLWDPKLQGKIGFWKGIPRESIGMALKSLGYSANSEKPEEVEAAIQQLITLKPHLFIMEDETNDDASTANSLLAGDIFISQAWSSDALPAMEENSEAVYVLPEEGALLWADNFVIPANSPNKYTAEIFLNFLLRPEISAEITNFNLYPSSNSAAELLIKKEILQNPIVYPPNERIRKAEIILPLSDAGDKLYEQAWKKFLEAAQ